MSEEIMRAALRKTPDCLSEEQLLSPETVSEKQHLASCVRCQAELKLLAGFLSAETSPEEEKNVNWIVKQLENKPVVRVPGWRSWFTLPRLGAISLALASLLVVISLRMTMREAPVVDEPGAGATNLRSGAVKLTAPSGDVSSAPHAFTWEAVAGASAYRVKLMEVDRNILWSAEINTFSIAVPEGLRAKIVPAKTLLWQVEALDASGKVIASSSPERFRVAPSEGK
jgi:hypothetical protein